MLEKIVRLKKSLPQWGLYEGQEGKLVCEGAPIAVVNFNGVIKLVLNELLEDITTLLNPNSEAPLAPGTNP